jgi:hypothetical protein
MMMQPLFVETSKGYMINLALVREIRPDGYGCISFIFSDEDRTDVSIAEGKAILRALRAERPELFLAA